MSRLQYSLIFMQLLSCLIGITADYASIAGYLPQNDVSQHLALDLDQNAIVTALADGNFSEAYNWYSQGGNSYQTTGVVRTIKGFSRSSLAGEKWFDIYRNYWNGDATYADGFTSAAAKATREYSDRVNPVVSDTARQEGFMKSSVFQNIWMYVIHEMEEAIEDCQNKTTGTHWDEAVAFYCGSMVGTSGASAGVLLFSLAEKRCKNFGTCVDDDDSEYAALVNQNIMQLFEQGRDYQYVKDGVCKGLVQTKEKIVSQMVIPLIQGTLRYLYFAPNDNTEKSRSELYAFATAILPLVNYYNPTAARIIRANTNITSTSIVSDGIPTVKSQIESVYPSLGISCAEVGGLTSSSYTSGYYPDMEPCTDSNSKKDNTLPAYGIALIVIFLVAFVVVAIYLIWRFYFNKKKGMLRLDDAGDLTTAERIQQV